MAEDEAAGEGGDAARAARALQHAQFLREFGRQPLEDYVNQPKPVRDSILAYLKTRREAISRQPRRGRLLQYWTVRQRHADAALVSETQIGDGRGTPANAMDYGAAPGSSWMQAPGAGNQAMSMATRAAQRLQLGPAASAASSDFVAAFGRAMTTRLHGAVSRSFRATSVHRPGASAQAQSRQQAQASHRAQRTRTGPARWLGRAPG